MDLTDEQWEVLKPLIFEPRRRSVDGEKGASRHISLEKIMEKME